MTARCWSWVLAGVLSAPLLAADDPPRSAPIYRVTVVQRTTRAVNYGHRTLPTRLDFQGTVLYPEAKGKAVVEPKTGRVHVDAKFSHLGTPARFGRQYLTYVLWAITPDGNAERLGELVTNHNDDAHVKVTTSLQSFALIVTAEPYFAVSKPGPMVVMENVVRPDTMGQIEYVDARYELLPRAESPTVDLNDVRVASEPQTPLVGMREYEALLALYQAQNAVQIARAEGADVYAPEVLSKAEALYREAQSIPDRKADSERIVTVAREAAQRAEDARLVAVKRKQAEAVPATALGRPPIQD
jgi:hypothetical protein